jgi:5-methylcytosine-specific restriction endonuclease McrA
MFPVFDNPWGGGNDRRRKPVGSGKKTAVLVRSKGRCQRCRRDLDGLKPHIHHRNGNPSDNRASNLIVLCPNCHSKEHFKKDGTSKKKGRVRKSSNPFDVKIPKLNIPTYKAPKMPKFSLI